MRGKLVWTGLLLLHSSMALVDPTKLSLLSPCGAGSFGIVRWAEYDRQPAVAKAALAGTKAAQYLAVEEHANRLLHEQTPGGSTPELAPFLGACQKSGHRWLVWKACGSDTLADYLARGPAGLAELAQILNRAADNGDLPASASPQSLAKTVLRCMLRALAHIHARGVVHRDLKPDNWLVDREGRCLVLIDFGSSVDVAGWLVQRGLEPDRVPASVLYCPCEQLLDAKAPYTYDIYSAALVMMRTAVPRLSEESLMSLRLELRQHRHDPHAWWQAADEAPDGWELAFGPLARRGALATPEQRELWELLCQMLAFDPSERPSAAEVLVGPFLNADCEAGGVPLPPPRPWTWQALVVARGEAEAVSEECALPPELPAGNGHDEHADESQSASDSMAMSDTDSADFVPSPTVRV